MTDNKKLTIRVYVDDEMKEKIKIATKKAKLSESAWVRQAILEKLEKEGF